MVNKLWMSFRKDEARQKTISLKPKRKESRKTLFFQKRHMCSHHILILFYNIFVSFNL